jgi:membrane fusion protein, multidrug efflux system
MKSIISFYSVLLVLLLSACGENRDKTGNLQNNDLEALRAKLIEKQSTYKALADEIEQLSKQITELDTTEKPRKLVTLDTIKTEDFLHYVDFQATVQSDEIARASSDIGGRIIRLLIKEGQMVQKGQLIAKLDVETLQRQLDELETNLALATTIYEKQQKLWDQKVGSEIQLIEAKSNKERLEKAKATLSANISKSSVYSPCSGVVEIANTKEGEFVGPGTPIATIVNIKKIKVVANLPESYIGKVKKGDRVMLNFPTLQQEIKATVNRIGKTISEGNRTFVVEASISQMTDDIFKPNLLARMRINDFTQKNTVVIKAELLQQESDGRSFVFVKSDDDTNPTATKQFVEIDKIYGDQILIKSGLKAGEIIIKEGARGLADKELITF